MNEDYEITCARCFVTMRGKDRAAVDTAFRGHEKEAHGFMTGQEFYDRFVEECKRIPNGKHPSIFDPVYDAAMKAAGLK